MTIIIYFMTCRYKVRLQYPQKSYAFSVFRKIEAYWIFFCICVKIGFKEIDNNKKNKNKKINSYSSRKSVYKIRWNEYSNIILK